VSSFLAKGLPNFRSGAISRGRDIAILATVPNVGIYLSESLHERMQRLKANGVELSASAVCRRCLEQAVEAEERALVGDRLARLLVRVRSTLTDGEQVDADARALGRRWAEDTAALSEMRRVAGVDGYRETNRLQAVGIEALARTVRVELIHWPLQADEPEPWDPIYIPASIPVEALNQVAKRKGTTYTDAALDGFVKGVTDVLNVIEDALRAEGEEVPPRRMLGGPDF
jgi:hypothetical protein